MNFSELLEDKDEKTEHLRKCETIVNEAKSALDAATVAHQNAYTAYVDAHKLIKERLITRGHHSTISEDGTIVIYQVNEESENGWSSYHPIPGEQK